MCDVRGINALCIFLELFIEEPEYGVERISAMSINFNSRGARAALGLIFATALTYPIVAGAAPAGGLGGAVGGALGGVTGGLGGTLGGVGGSLGGAIGSAAGSMGGMNGSPNGPLGTISGGTFGPSLGGLTGGSTAGRITANLNVAAQVAVELRQRVNGRLVSLGSDALTLRLDDGNTKNLQAHSEFVASLRPFVGKNVFLRSVDGVHISSVVGQNDTVRGTLTAINGGLVTFVSPNGEVHSITLPTDGIAKSGLRVGVSVVSTSNDFGRTGRLALLKISPRSSLSDVYIGNVIGLTDNTLKLGIGNNLQLFTVDSSLVSALTSLQGRTIALISADGATVQNLLAARTLDLLTSAALLNNRIRAGAAASVIATTRKKIIAQLVNGDTMTLLSQGPSLLSVKARVPVVITPLDSLHVRVRAGAQVLNLLNADACATVNAGCRGSLTGRAVAVSPTALSVRLPNGDINTFLGNIRSLDLTAGVPIVITPLDAVKARISAGANVMNVVKASACVTINSGCKASPATVLAVSPAQLQLRLPDGAITNLRGNPTPLGLSANVPVQIQPLDNQHVIVVGNAQVAQLADANACLTVNASCVGNSGGIPSSAPGSVTASGCISVNGSGCAPGTGGTPAAGNTGGVTAGGCVSVNGSGCAPASAGGPGTGNGGTVVGALPGIPGGGNATPPGGGNSGGNSNGNGNGNGNRNGNGDAGGAGGGSSGPAWLENSSGIVQLAFEGAPACSEDGQVAVSVSNAKSGIMLQDATVGLMGHQSVVWRTSQDGTVRYLRLPSGTYRVRVEKSGYASILSPEFNVDCRAAASLNFKLAAIEAASKRTAIPSTVAILRAPRLTRTNVVRVVKKAAMCVCQKRSQLQKAAARRHMSHRSSYKVAASHHFICSH